MSLNAGTSGRVQLLTRLSFSGRVRLGRHLLVNALGGLAGRFPANMCVWMGEEGGGGRVTNALETVGTRLVNSRLLTPLGRVMPQPRIRLSHRFHLDALVIVGPFLVLLVASLPSAPFACHSVASLWILCISRRPLSPRMALPDDVQDPVINKSWPHC